MICTTLPEEFKNRHYGKSCAILANGESLNDFKRSDWQGISIGLNKSWQRVDSLYHCMIDIRQIQAAPRHVYQFRHLFVGSGHNEKVEAAKLDALRDVHAKYRIKLPPGKTDRYHRMLSLDLAEPWIPNVLIMSIQVGWWLGFRRFEFWGLDLDGGKFYDSDWVMMPQTTKLQNAQLALARRTLEPLGGTFVNHSTTRAVWAIPKAV